jgi:hypothetical protein
VALQGTLDSFDLPDVLRLLASTRKTGCLRVEGDRGTGSVWLSDGSVVGTEASGVRGDSEVDVIFNLLCFRAGTFFFQADAAPSLPSRPIDVEPLINEAERLLIEWRDIEKVVPSVDAWVSLLPTLPRSEMYIDPHRWKTIVSIGSGTTVAALGRALETGDTMACLVVKDLVDMGLAEVRAAAMAGPPIDTAQPHYSAPPNAPLASMAPPPPPPLASRTAQEASAIAAAQAPPSPPPVPMMAAAPTELTVTPPHAPPGAPPAEQPAEPIGLGPVGQDEDDPEEVARQLATLSPKAARAVAAASDPNHEAEPEDMYVEVDGMAEEDEAINRNLLIKFLSSVKN